MPWVIVTGSFVIASAVNEYTRQVRRIEGSPVTAAGRVLRRDPGYWGGQMAHIGVALLAVGIAASSGLATRDQVQLTVGEPVQLEGYCLNYEGPTSRVEPNRQVDGARLTLLTADCSRELATMEPVFNRYTRPPAVATPAVHTGFTEDVFIALAAVPGDSVVVDVSVFPLMWVLWLGGLIAVGGGLWGVAAKKRTRPVASANRDVLEDA